jgi:hypothetical protein
MVGWQITAKTIYCDAVDDEITIIISKNGPATCTGCKKYNEPNRITCNVIKQKTRRLKRPIKCEGEKCSRVTQYQDKILAEEKGKS